MTKPSLPKTDSISGLDRFWDRHDVTDFEDLLEEVSELVFLKGKEVLVHLKPDRRGNVRLLRLGQSGTTQPRRLAQKMMLERYFSFIEASHRWQWNGQP